MSLDFVMNPYNVDPKLGSEKYVKSMDLAPNKTEQRTDGFTLGRDNGSPLKQVTNA